MKENDITYLVRLVDASALGLTDAQVDDLFKLAATL